MLERIVDLSAGNAFYLEELIRAVAEAKEAGREATDLPATVLAMVQTRLEMLEPEARRLLRAASVFGEMFWTGGVKALLGGEEDTQDVVAWLTELVHRELIVDRGEARFRGEAQYGFRHALLREGAYAMLTPNDCALGHKLAGEWLEAAGERDASVLADHFERGGEHGRAAQAYHHAAEQALEANDLDAAIARAEKALAVLAEGPQKGALRILQAEAQAWSGRLDEAAAASTDAMRALPRGNKRWCHAAERAVYVLGQLGRYDDVDRVTAEILDASAEPDARGAYVLALARASWFLGHAGQHVRAETLLARMEELSPEVAPFDPALDAQLDSIRAGAALYAGQAERCLRLSEQAARKFLATGDLRSSFLQEVYLGDSYKELGAYEEARDRLRHAAEGAERIGLATVSVLARFNLAMTLARCGTLTEARAMEEAAIEAFLAQGQRRLGASARDYMAMILALSGELDLAALQAEASVAGLELAPATQASALATLGHIELLRGRPEAALAAARRGIARLEALHGRMGEGESLLRLTFAEALDATGDHEGARVALTTARARLEERAATIRDAALRESFLTRVPENARTMDLAMRLGDVAAG